MKRSNPSLAAAVVACSLGALALCATAIAADNGSQSSPSSTSSVSGAGMNTGAPGTAGESAKSQSTRDMMDGSNAADAKLSDAQIAQILMSANQADIEAGQLAKSKSSDSRVKQMADHMIKDHTASNSSLKKLGVKPSDSDDSRGIKKDAMEAKSDLQKTNASDFDKKYVEHEVSFHQQTLDKIDNDLMPNARSQKVKDLLTKTRPTIEQHLAHAKSLKNMLDQKAGTAGSDDKMSESGYQEQR